MSCSILRTHAGESRLVERLRYKLGGWCLGCGFLLLRLLLGLLQMRCYVRPRLFWYKDRRCRRCYRRVATAEAPAPAPATQSAISHTSPGPPFSAATRTEASPPGGHGEQHLLLCCHHRICGRKACHLGHGFHLLPHLRWVEAHRPQRAPHSSHDSMRRRRRCIPLRRGGRKLSGLAVPADWAAHALVSPCLVTVLAAILRISAPVVRLPHVRVGLVSVSVSLATTSLRGR